MRARVPSRLGSQGRPGRRAGARLPRGAATATGSPAAEQDSIGRLTFDWGHAVSMVHANQRGEKYVHSEQAVAWNGWKGEMALQIYNDRERSGRGTEGEEERTSRRRAWDMIH